MTCYSPLEGFRSMEVTKNGKRKIAFSKKSGYVDLPVTVACGQCIGCRLERSRQWAVRIMHEAQLHEQKCFLTLTYSPENIPLGNSLRKEDFQKFMKRLRKHHGGKLKYFHCGEYGSTTLRPHYHAIIFGTEFSDREPFSKNVQGDVIYRSDVLDKIWGLGHCTIGAVTHETAAYTARYIMKKVTGEAAKSHYFIGVDQETGEVLSREPEYITMSLKPSIGSDWYEKFKADVYPSDFVVSRGSKLRVPRYYDKKLEQESPSALDQIKRKRVKDAAKRKADTTPERLRVRREVQLEKMKFLKREAI